MHIKYFEFSYLDGDVVLPGGKGRLHSYLEEVSRKLSWCSAFTVSPFSPFGKLKFLGNAGGVGLFSNTPTHVTQKLYTHFPATWGLKKVCGKWVVDKWAAKIYCPGHCTQHSVRQRKKMSYGSEEKPSENGIRLYTNM